VNVPEKIEHFIGGRPAGSVAGGTFGVADPVSNRVYAQVAAGDAEDVERAVTAADEAFRSGPWPGRAARARAKVLNKIADGIEARAARIAAMETFDTGLPITQAKGQAARAAENFRYFADVIVARHEEAFSSPGQLGYVLRRPAGVAGLITPWNTPFMLESWKLAPALASGCTVVLKPAEWTPLSASLLPEIMNEAGVPDGVFNIVHGVGEQAGDHDRPGHHALGGRPPEDPVDGARRQVAVRHLRRRGPGRGDRLRFVRGDVAERRAVHRWLADPGRTLGV
jgi:5-carboxymethyl-2-hydroxymuconic-semialdehyde dehydrogenase